MRLDPEMAVDGDDGGLPRGVLSLRRFGCGRRRSELQAQCDPVGNLGALTTRSRGSRAGALLLVAITVAGCGAGPGTRSPGDNPLFRDPMADVQVAGAERIARDVHPGTDGGAVDKSSQARLDQMFRAATPTRAMEVRELLKQRALEAGWTPTVAATTERFDAEKSIGGQHARLNLRVYRGNPNQVLLSLIGRPVDD